MSQPAAFTLFGFPVHVRSGFLVFLVIVVLANGPDFGLWMALFVAVFTLLHELGHAFAARATGAKAEIALDFLYGYASFVPTRHLRRIERAGIAFAGPATQIIVSVGVLLAADVNPLDFGAYRDLEYWQLALLWAGPAIGLFNLIPVMPFDGGTIALTAVEVFVGPSRARTFMLWASVTVTVAAIVILGLNPETMFLAIFMAFPLIAQLQMISGRRRQAEAARNTPEVRAAAEAKAWTQGTVDQFTGGLRPSPWFEAVLLADNGRHDDARRTLLGAFDDEAPRHWTLPDAAPAARLAELVGLLPRPLPLGNDHAEFALADVLCTLGEYDEAARYAATAYTARPTPGLALVVARAAAALGDVDTMKAWLRTAAADAAQGFAISDRQRRAPELADHLRDPDVVGILSGR